MPVNQPQHRKVRCRVLIANDWVEGTFRVPPLRNFSEHLGGMHEFEVLSDVRFLASGHREPFFDVHRSAIRLVMPPEDECEPQVPSPPEVDAEHQVLLLLEGGHLKGRLSLRKGLRVSDFFRSRNGFVVLHDCTFVPRDLSSEEGASEPFPSVVVNTDAVLGVTEPHSPD